MKNISNFEFSTSELNEVKILLRAGLSTIEINEKLGKNMEWTILACSKVKKYTSHNDYYTFGKGAIKILQSSSKKKNILFSLTKESLTNWWSITPNICFYCNVILDEYLKNRDFIVLYKGNNFEIKKFMRFYYNSNWRKINKMTIDRMDNHKGYILNNIVKACWICNSLKSDFFSANEMKVISKSVISKLRDEINKEKQKLSST